MKSAIKKAPPRMQATWLAELDLIRRPLLVFGTSVLLAGCAIGFSHAYLQRQRAAHEQARLAQLAAFDRYNHVESDKLDLRNFEQPYRALLAKGLIGPENRLDWIDAIRRSQEQRKLLPITYDIDAQQVLQPDARMALGPYQLHGSKMTLHMDLLHEMDLFNFFADLRQRNYFAVQACTLKRIGAGDGAAPAPSLSADCTLYRLTLGAPR